MIQFTIWFTFLSLLLLLLMWGTLLKADLIIPLSDQLWSKGTVQRGKNNNMRTMKQDWSFPIRGKQHFWSASLVSLVTNLQASGSLGSCVLCSALAPWPVKKCTQRLILCVTKGQMKPQLDCSWRGRIPTSFSVAQYMAKSSSNSFWFKRGVNP